LPACPVRSASCPLEGSWYYPQRTRCYASAVGASTRHPQRVAAGIPRGNRAGTPAESNIYSQQTRKIRRLHVYARKHVENKAAKEKMGGSRFLRE
jgi:hypothetical protein